jgi:metal-responsive CopG/Arc/MetJ family transcriptional regulator
VTRRIPITASMHPRLLDLTDRFSEEHYCSRSATISHALVEFFKTLERQKRELDKVYGGLE